MDFDNCWAIRCSGCPRFFCAWCMTYDCDTMDACHDHVRECRDNPNPGAVYGDYVYWRNRHVPEKRQRRINDTVNMVYKEVMGPINDSLIHSLRNLD